MVLGDGQFDRDGGYIGAVRSLGHAGFARVCGARRMRIDVVRTHGVGWRRDMTPAVVFENVRKQYGRVIAVDHVDVSLAPGSIVGLIGHNGAGKSACLQMMAGLVRPTEGRVRIDGVDVVREPQRARKHLGVVAEEPALYEYLTARELLEFVSEVRGVDGLDEGLEPALWVQTPID